MRLAICSTLVLGLVGLAACDNGPLDASAVSGPKMVTAPSDAGAAAAPGGDAVNSSKSDAAIDVTPLAEASRPDAAAEAASPIEVYPPDARDDIVGPATDATDVSTDERVADPAPLPSCAALAAGGDANQLDTFRWMYEVGPTGGPYNRPYDIVTLHDGCQMTYQKTILPPPTPPAPGVTTRTVTLNAADCAAARAWPTNARVLDVLVTGDDCPSGPGNPDDEIEVNLTDGTMDRRKTYLCPEPTLDALRACVSALVARSFP